MNIVARPRRGLRHRRERPIEYILDVTGRKQTEEAHELLVGETGHCVENLLPIVSGLTTTTPQSTTSAEIMART